MYWYQQMMATSMQIDAEAADAWCSKKEQAVSRF